MSTGRRPGGKWRTPCSRNTSSGAAARTRRARLGAGPSDRLRRMRGAAPLCVERLRGRGLGQSLLGDAAAQLGRGAVHACAIVVARAAGRHVRILSTNGDVRAAKSETRRPSVGGGNQLQWLSALRLHASCSVRKASCPRTWGCGCRRGRRARRARGAWRVGRAAGSVRRRAATVALSDSRNEEAPARRHASSGSAARAAAAAASAAQRMDGGRRCRAAWRCEQLVAHQAAQHA